MIIVIALREKKRILIKRIYQILFRSELEFGLDISIIPIYKNFYISSLYNFFEQFKERNSQWYICLFLKQN